MKILFLAPHPFYQERGTPIAVDILLRVLSGRGDHIDVVTYHEGEDRSYSGPGRVRIYRIDPPPACREIRPGFSLKKIIADLWLYRKVRTLLTQSHFDVIHAVEESVFIARHFGRAHAIPYVFDMDSDMPQQIFDKLPWMRPMVQLLRWFERKAIADAAAVAVVCDALAERVTKSGASRTFILHDVCLQDLYATPASGMGFRQMLGISGPCAVYIGNLEPYQGIDLLLESWTLLPASCPADLVIIGGIPKHITYYRARAVELGIAHRVHLPGPRPLSDLTTLLSEADILVSPRIQGYNTPMKIYSYMAAGKPIVATNILTHTQVLSPKTALLVPPQPSVFAKAIADLLSNQQLRDALSRAAAEEAKAKYSFETFNRTVNEMYNWLQLRATQRRRN